MTKEEKENMDGGMESNGKLAHEQVFCPLGVKWEDTVEWDRDRTAEIKGADGSVIFIQEGIHAPKEWSQLATNIVASKYFHGEPGTAEREYSVAQLIRRVTSTIAKWGLDDGYFATPDDAQHFENDLSWLILHQYFSFNSPVWFNVGVEEKPQTSACFIQHVDDTLDSIMKLAVNEANLFKYGSGTGTDLSSIRSAKEKLSGGGKPSGPLSFMRIYNEIAGVVKSGGKTRRAAKMQSLKVDHPDIMDFIECKTREEKKAKILMDHGYSYEEAYSTIPYQNANLSVRVSDAFMQAVEADDQWETRWVTDRSIIGPKYKAKDIFRKIAECTWECGDPGLQFEDTINEWHTCPKSGRINASNPCLAGDAMIATKDGWKAIKDLVGVETEVYGSDGKLHHISGSFVTGEKDVYKVEVVLEEGQRTEILSGVTATGNHKILTPKGDIPVSDLFVGDEVLWSTVTCNPEDEIKTRVAKIKSIQYVGKETVYDITEPETSHFVANGVIVHNCSEYMFLDESACNLGSINLVKFSVMDMFMFEKFERCVEIVFIAQDILIDHSHYPTPEITNNSKKFRPIGLGFSNLGSLIMRQGYGYDSETGRGICAGLSAILTGLAYRTSTMLAEAKGAFKGYATNRTDMLGVIDRYYHYIKLGRLKGKGCPDAFEELAEKVWSDVVVRGEKFGFRNAQATVLAPCGTIGFMMDCDTTGIEPSLALVQYKTLVGGGLLTIVNSAICQALHSLGYSNESIEKIEKYVKEHGYIEGAPGLKQEDVAVFDCAFPARGSERCLSWQAHIKMMSAAQMFITGAISKTVNMPKTATVEDIQAAYMMAWKSGLKGIAIYRDGSKGMQPVSTSKEDESESPKESRKERKSEKVKREKLPDTRDAKTHKFTVNNYEGYLTTGFYPDKRIGEVFITMNKNGSTIGGLMDCFSTAISLGLQYGVPLQVYVEKFVHNRFEPMGFTKNPEIPIAKSIVDYIFRYLELEYINKPAQEKGEEPEELNIPQSIDDQFGDFQSDAPLCDVCGSITVRNGSCYLCHNCGKSLGCS